MVKRERMLAALLGVLVVALGAAIGWQLRPKAAGPAAAAASPGPDPAIAGLERIGLSRLDAKPSSASAGDTDVFQFGAPSTKVALRATPPPTLVAPPVTLPEIVASPTPPPVPIMNVKYIGTVGDKKGLKVAILMTDRKEVLTGRPGDVVANRLKIVSIGLESVDVQDVGSDHVRRIPLRAN
jgi:hypothetical protein